MGGGSPQEERNMLLWRNQRTHNNIPFLCWESFPCRGRALPCRVTQIQAIHFSPLRFPPLLDNNCCSEGSL